MSRAAAGYARRGWFVFPLKPSSKEPLTGHGVHDASSDPQIVTAWWREWPESNIGLDVHRSGLIVVDLDVLKGGIEAWERLCAEYRVSPYTALRSRTGSGGMHLIYRQPLGVTIHNSKAKLGPGIDIRGWNGYIAIPPSIHANGNVYAWID